MQRVLSKNLWREVRSHASKARQRKAAIAYVTKDHLGLTKGDVLITNASQAAISCGETDAKLLRTLFQRGVQLYHCPDLHAKVMLLDDKAVVGSGNMSASSINNLVEAAVLTDHVSTVAGVASFIEQLIGESKLLTKTRITQLCKIKVIRRGNPAERRVPRKTKIAPLGNRTWIIGVRELVRDPSSEEQKMISKAADKLEMDEDDLHWVRWPNRGTFVRDCREGDSLIEICRSSSAERPSYVSRSTGVLLKQRAKTWSRFYLQPRQGKHVEMSWGNFQRMLKKLGYPKRVGPKVTQLVDTEMADAIERVWKDSVS